MAIGLIPNAKSLAMHKDNLGRKISKCCYERDFSDVEATVWKAPATAAAMEETSAEAATVRTQIII
jgi:hypothetical protein